MRVSTRWGRIAMLAVVMGLSLLAGCTPTVDQQEIEFEVPVFIAQGIRDPIVQRDTAAEVFNPLVKFTDRLTADQVTLFGQGLVPPGLATGFEAETFFEAGDPAPVFARQSGPVLLVYFDAGHDMVYGAAARWFASDPG